MNLGGSLTRQSEADHPIGEGSPHISNLGRMVEVGVVGNLTHSKYRITSGS